jgi:hypothetical protein
MNKALVAALIAAAAAGCASNTKEAKLKNPAPCPNVVVLEDAARQIIFNGQQTIEDVAWSAEVENVSLACRYVGDKPIDAGVKINLALGRGPKADANEHQFGYWVAVTRTNREVIAKQEYVLPIKFGDETVKRASQEIDQIIIPRKSEQTSGENFEIVVGLTVTPQQATYNRSGKSLKFPDL